MCDLYIYTIVCIHTTNETVTLTYIPLIVKVTLVLGDMKSLSEHSSNDPFVILVSLADATDMMLLLSLEVSVA